VIKLETRVEKILIEGGRAIGVRLEGGTEIRASNVVSNADPAITYGRLIGDELLPNGLKKKLGKTKWSTTAVSLFFAVEADVKALGLDSGNYWLCPGLDADAAYTAMAKSDVLDLEELPGIFVSITSLKDPSSFNGKHHTGEAFTFVPYEIFEKYANAKSGEHGQEYADFKARIAAKMLAAIEKRIPGLTRKVVFQDLGSPLTNVHYVEATRGNIYGTEKVLGQMGPFGFKQASVFKGLTLCGASTMGHGVPGAALSGLNAAALMLECRMEDLLKKDQPKIQILSAQTWKAPARRAEIASTTAAVPDYPTA
jgi:all-trans-retinol 13,14-reductase